MIAALSRYIDWVRGEALPFWAPAGFDDRAARFHERLDLAGHPLSVPHRAMVQARQVYVFAHAAMLGWLPEGGKIAERAMVTLWREFCDGHGCDGAAFAVDPATGTIVAHERDAYAHAFLLFATAYLYRLTVALNSDASTRRLKGPTRPIQDERARAAVMGGLRGVATVILFDEDTPLKAIERLQPDILVKGADYTEDSVVGAGIVKARGGRVLLAGLVSGQSTSRLVAASARPVREAIG